MKSNDNIPADEMLLAEAIAAAKARGMKWCSDRPFARMGSPSAPDKADSCCALGALCLAGKVSYAKALIGEPRSIRGGLNTRGVWTGNDEWDYHWSHEHDDLGESLGWAYRCAMTEDGQ